MSLQLARLWQPFCKYWDPDAMLKGGDLGAAAIADMDRMVQGIAGDLPGMEVMLWATSVVAQAVGYKARWLAGCHCHEALAQVVPLYRNRVKMLESFGLDKGFCCWFGRRGPSLALGAVKKMMAVVQNASSDQDRIALMSAPEHVRIMCLRFEQHIKHRWCEVVEADHRKRS